MRNSDDATLRAGVEEAFAESGARVGLIAFESTTARNDYRGGTLVADDADVVTADLALLAASAVRAAADRCRQAGDHGRADVMTKAAELIEGTVTGLVALHVHGVGHG